MVNRLDPSVVERRGYLNIRDFYYKLCTLQGELTDWSHVFVPAADLLKRAVFLEDGRRFRSLAGISDFNDYPVEYAIGSGISDITAIALCDGLLERPLMVCMLDDLTVLDRQPRLRDFYRKQIEGYVSGAKDQNDEWGRRFVAGNIAGYLDLFDLKEKFTDPHNTNYIVGYLKAKLKTEPVRPIPEFDQIFQEIDHHSERTYVAMSRVSYPFHIRTQSQILVYLEVGLTEILPNNVQYVLDNIEPAMPGLGEFEKQIIRKILELPERHNTSCLFPSRTLRITPDLVARAGRMIPLVKRLPAINGFPSDRYLTLLSVLIGEDVEDFGHELPTEVNTIIGYMIVVAHPGVQAHYAKMVPLPSFESDVYYDIPNLLSVSLELDHKYASDCIKTVLSHLIRVGQVVKYLNDRTFQLFFPKPSEFGIIGDLDRVVLNPKMRTSSWRIENQFTTVQLLLKARQYNRPIQFSKTFNVSRTWSQVAEIETFLDKPLEYRESYFSNHQKREEKYQEVLAELQS